MSDTSRVVRLGLAVWVMYGLWTYLAVLPDVPSDGLGRMAALKLIRTATGCAMGLALVGLLLVVRRTEARAATLGAIGAVAVVSAGYLWLGLYQGLSAPLRSPTFFPVSWSSLPRAGLDHVFVLLAWGGLAFWWIERSLPDGSGVHEPHAPPEPLAKATLDRPKMAGSAEPHLRADDHIYLRLDDEMVLLQVHDITAILAEGDYTTVVRDGCADALSDRSMKRWEATLPPRRFARVHRSAIVNLACVQQLEERPSGGQLLHLAGGRRVPMSRRYEARLKTTLG